MNRYSEISPSAYSPMTFEEIAMVPLMKRKQHDDVLAKQELIRSGLAKVDPLKEHLEEALRLKQGIESQMDNTALELSKNGINNDMIGKTIALNRQYQDLVSPTGRLGQINTAKTIFNKEKEDFIKYAESQKIGKEVAEQRWKEKTSDYTGFDKDNKIINVSPQGVAAFQDYGLDLTRAHSVLGKTVEGLSSSGHHLEQGKDGGFWEVTKNGKRVKSNNTNQVEAAYNSFRDKWITENGEGTKYSKDAALGIDEKRIRNDFNSMLENSNILDSSESSNYNTPPKDGENPEDPNNPDSIPEAVTTINSNEDLLNDLKNFKPNTLIPYSAIPIDPKDTSENKTFIRKQNEINRLNNTYEKKLNNNPEYIDLAQKIINQSPSLKGLKITDQKVVNATLNYLNKHQNTQTVNRIITPTTSKDTRGYSADEISKYTKMKQDAMETSIRNGMKVFDENGNEIKKPVSSNIIYNGEYTFNSVVPIKHTNSKTKFAPIAATMLVKGDNGVTEEHKVYVEQNPDREKDPLFKAQYTAFQTLNKANKYRGLKQPLKNTFTEENLGLRDVDVTYNDDGSIILEGKHYNGKNWEKMPPQYFQNDSDFVNYIHNLYN